MKIIYEKDAIDALHKTMLDFFKTNDDDKPEFITASEKMLLSVNKAISKALKALPSAQSEIVRCKDCKHWEYDVIFADGWCRGKQQGNPEWYCADAERRTDE